MKRIAAILLATTLAAHAWVGGVGEIVDGPEIDGQWIKFTHKSLSLKAANAEAHKTYQRVPTFSVITGTEEQVDEITGETSVVNVSQSVPYGVLRADGTIESPTLAEWQSWEPYLVALSAAAEQARQQAKPDALKNAENAFLAICNTLLDSYEKATFSDLNEVIEPMMSADPSTATYLSLRLLAIDAEAKREGGLHWWDDCALHPEMLGGE